MPFQIELLFMSDRYLADLIHFLICERKSPSNLLTSLLDSTIQTLEDVINLRIPLGNTLRVTMRYCLRQDINNPLRNFQLFSVNP